MLLVVSVIIAALASTDLGREISRQAKVQICRIAETPCEKRVSKKSTKRSRAAAPLARTSALRDPKGNDSDGDGVSDARERARHTDPGNPDSDGDGYGDASDPAPRDPDLDNDGLLDGEDPVPGHDDVDRDGLTDGQEVALGTNPRSRDTDGDGRPDRAEFDAGSDPTKRVLPLTEENALKPWLRVGLTEQQWWDFTKKMLEEYDPKGWRKWIESNPYWGVNLDKDGNLKLLEVNQMASVNPRAVLKLLGAGEQAAERHRRRREGRGQGADRGRRGADGAQRDPRGRAHQDTGAAAGRDHLRAVGQARPRDGRRRDDHQEHAQRGHPRRGRIKPPGFADGAVHDRGHLIGKLLGGLGSDARNLTTMFKNANTPVMREFEKQIADAVRGGQVVRYQVTPIYKGSDQIARGITMKAFGSGKNPLNLHVTVLNIPKP